MKYDNPVAGIEASHQIAIDPNRTYHHINEPNRVKVLNDVYFVTGSHFVDYGPYELMVVEVATLEDLRNESDGTLEWAEPRESITLIFEPEEEVWFS